MSTIAGVLALSLAAPCGSPAHVASDSTWFAQTYSVDVTADGVPDSLLLRAFGARIDSLCVEFSVVVDDTVRFRDFWLTDWYFIYDGPVGDLDSATVWDRVQDQLTSFFDRDQFGELDAPSSVWGVPLADGAEPREHVLWDYTFQHARDSLLAQGVDSARAAGMARLQAWNGPHDSTAVRAIWDDMKAHPPLTFTFFSGGEHTRTIAWSRLERRFLVVFSCC